MRTDAQSPKICPKRQKRTGPQGAVCILDVPPRRLYRAPTVREGTLPEAHRLLGISGVHSHSITNLPTRAPWRCSSPPHTPSHFHPPCFRRNAHFLRCRPQHHTASLQRNRAPGGYKQFKISLTAPALEFQRQRLDELRPRDLRQHREHRRLQRNRRPDRLRNHSEHPRGRVLQFKNGEHRTAARPPGLRRNRSRPCDGETGRDVSSSITVDPTKAPWLNGNSTYSVNANPGTFTVGGTLSIQDVTPAVGLLPAGTVLTINGTGFDATTTVAIDGVSLCSHPTRERPTNQRSARRSHRDERQAHPRREFGGRIS